MTPAQFRKLALSMPGAVEGSHQDHPDFRANGRVFASLHPDGTRGMVKVPPAEQQRLVSEHAGAFEPANGAWGRAGCTMVTLAAVSAAVARDALTLAWQVTVSQVPTKTANRNTPRRAKRSAR